MPEIELLQIKDYALSALHIFVIALRLGRLKVTRDQFLNAIQESGIGAAVHYIPLHLQPAFSYLGHKEGDFPISEKICFNEISIPINQFMSEEDAHYVCDAIEKILN